MMDGPRAVRHDELVDAGQTPGMTRWAAFEEPGVWVGVARTAPGSVSGWHHHGDNTTYVYCQSGALRMESGPGGRDTVEAGPGDFMVIPANTVHRESNPADTEGVVILTRVGTGPVLTNVEGPDPA
jgi:uncharacterized RmlC-like cupin family protein